jgi:hypothetical protein
MSTNMADDLVTSWSRGVKKMADELSDVMTTKMAVRLMTKDGS